jgi:RNA polymerase sigma-70 factor (ECF subfamily)
MVDEEHLTISAATSVPTPSERELFAMVYRRMTALAGPGASDLDDLVQIAAEQVFQNLASFDGRSELLTWVYTICYRVLLRQRRWYRRWQARFTLQHQELVVASDEPSASAALEARERVAELQHALGRLSDKYRAAVVLCDLEELPVREVARIVGANELTVRSRLRDGRKQLQRLLLATPNILDAGGRHELSGS